MFFKIGVLKNFAIFTGKQPCWSLFLMKFIKDTPLQVFSSEYCAKFLTAFLKKNLPLVAPLIHTKIIQKFSEFSWLLI